MPSFLSFETRELIPSLQVNKHPYVIWFPIFVLFPYTRFHFSIQIQTLEVFTRV